ncbi:aldose 1-epimerase [uncultured Polaribacter sp.]|uniref:aldose 1-epimerase n=1 Tax=uncultured Polaribacter sp. TaxID=174711 RepID=UPI0026098A32|nr:aldose 1-epimerase [uncultured Polaribacter sp.]
MFRVDEIAENSFKFLELKNTKDGSMARISLSEGGRLQNLKFNAISLIEDQANFDYKDSYASAILFPFVSRIENGAYTFNDKKYKFNCNQSDGKNALHGLVYNKEFKILEKKYSSNSCAVKIYYSEKNESQGFPFKYSMYLTYTLLKNELQLQVLVKNDDNKAFPFVLGWHPYFISDDLDSSYLNFKSDKKIMYDENLITKEIVSKKTVGKFHIESKQLDDCFVLEDNAVQFSTSKYHVQLSSNSKENFLQLYTPKNRSAIAIEPMTGISNSFNNKIGLQVLAPNASHNLKWTLKLL